MIVADTSALVSLAVAESLDPVLGEFEVHTTATVRGELDDTAAYDDVHGRAAARVLDERARFEVHETDPPEILSTRVDPGEASCVALARFLDAPFLVTDDLRALPELQELTDARVALLPIVLRALVERDVLDSREARRRVEQLAEGRDWLGAPIFRRAMGLFEGE